MQSECFVCLIEHDLRRGLRLLKGHLLGGYASFSSRRGLGLREKSAAAGTISVGNPDTKLRRGDRSPEGKVLLVEEGKNRPAARLNGLAVSLWRNQTVHSTSVEIPYLRKPLAPKNLAGPIERVYYAWPWSTRSRKRPV